MPAYNAPAEAVADTASRGATQHPVQRSSDMGDAYASDSSGGRHPAEDLIIQKALRRAACTAASTSNIHDLPAHAQAR